MKHLILLLAISVMGIMSYGQSGEFYIYPNGLIYSDTTMHRLKFIVDSLQLKFRRCDMTRDYYSMRQGKARYIKLDSGKIKEALADMRSDIGYEYLIKKYPEAKVDSLMLMTEDEYEDRGHQKELVYDAHAGSDRYEKIYLKVTPEWKEDTTEYVISGRKGRWVYKYANKTSYSHEKIWAYYFPAPLTTQKIPDTYARWILYSDCMTDTTTSVFFKDAYTNGWQEPVSKAPAPAQGSFWRYVDSCSKKALARRHVKKSSYEYDIEKDKYIKDSLSCRPAFRRLLAAAADEMVYMKVPTSFEFEDYTGLYYSKHVALLMKRNKHVVGQCSMDQSPRIHAMNIAQLAAETADWSVFLKAHLDIMNDRFDRMTDGSYAWGRRQTYLKELEELDIDVDDLLLGTTLRISNASDNHYWGSIGRMGRAIAESKQRQQLEEKILGMIRDTTLDDYNRLLEHYLYLNYLYYTPARDARLQGIKKLEEADKTMPAYISGALQFKHENIEKGAANGL